MQLNASNATPESVKSERHDPRGFVMSIALTLFAVTVLAVITMQIAHEQGWQIL